MTVKGTFKLGGDIIEVIINGNNLIFMDISKNTLSTLDGLKLDKKGVMEEFPDLKDNDNWKEITKDRLKKHIRKMKSEDKKLEYIKKELIKYGGYVPLFKQKIGHRPRKF